MMLHKKVALGVGPREGKMLALSCLATLILSPLLSSACVAVLDGDGDGERPTPDGPPTDGNTDAFLGGFFPIAVDGPRPDDYQGSTDCSAAPATGDYAGWSSCGVNTIARGPNCSDTSCPAAFDAQVTAAGLHMIRAPLANPAQDIAKHAADHLLLAWSQMDEPDANGGLSRNLPGLSSRYASLTALAGHPPVYLNVGGSDLIATNQPYQQAFAQADWVANDIYPVAGFLDDQFMRGDLTLVGKALDKFAEVATDKPRFAWIETNNLLGQGDPTPAQVRAEIWIAIVHGARGILYFQEQVEPTFDLLSTSAAVRTEMGKQHAAITQLSAILQGAINPPSMGASAVAPLEVGWRQSISGRYIIAVNSSPSTLSTAAVTLTGLVGAQAAMVWGESRMIPVVNGRVVDEFAPYARHIYVIPQR